MFVVMKLRLILLVVVSPLLISACSEKPSTNTEIALPAAPVNLPADADVSLSTKAPGGYVPTPAERVPGITMSQQELDQIYAEARKNMPVPVIPSEVK